MRNFYAFKKTISYFLMIKLSSKSYVIKNIDSESFFKQLDSITCGQAMNPEFSYSTQHLGKFENVFGGRKRGNKFSIYLYRPIEQGMRTEILAKGIVTPTEQGIAVDIRYEIPFWSILMFVLFGGLVFLLFLGNLGWIMGMVPVFILLVIYMAILNSNHIAVKSEIYNQFKKMK